MKILISTDTYMPRVDGISSFLKQVVPRLSSHHKVTILAPEHLKSYKDEYDVIRFKQTKFDVADFSPTLPEKDRIRRAVKEADIIFNQTIGPIGATTIWYASKMKKPVISFIHCIDWELAPKATVEHELGQMALEKISRKFAQFMYNKCHLLIVPSLDVKKKLINNDIHTKKIVVNLGVDVKRFDLSADKALAKQRIGIPPDRLVISYLGRLSREKNIRLIYRVFNKLKKRYKLHLLLIGDGPQKDLIYVDHVTVTGFKDNVEDYLKASDIFVMPSFTETTSLSTMEAMACGIPVIATPVGYIKEYVKDGINGYLMERNGFASMLQKVELLINNATLRQEMGLLARRSMVDHQNWDDVVDKIEQALADIKRRLI